jgi:single-stranded-DNA-specific exonuclease
MRDIPSINVVSDLAQSLNELPDPLARALVLRGIDSFEAARSFFRPTIERLHDPFEMRDMDAAADRLARAIRKRESVLVYGDYDVDGVTSTTLMTRFLRDQGVGATYFIPDRSKHGYGLSDAGFDAISGCGASLMITLDCGITSVGPAARARALGLDLIICDHHTAPDTLPDAVAVLDPKRADCAYPFKELSGCGVGFKLVQATLARLGLPDEEAYPLLDLVAVSIAADIVPMDGENRILMSEGLKLIRNKPRIGLSALAESAHITLADCTTGSIVFGIAPRINAAGRLDDASLAVQLLLETDFARARQLARGLEELNTRRKALDKETAEQAESQARHYLESRDRTGIVLHDPSWHAGVIGITASRIVETFCRPTILLTTVDGVAKGSARSVDGVNIYDALCACDDLLIQYGGHIHAAGLKLHEADVDAFRIRFEEAVAAQMTADLMVHALHIDSEVSFDQIDGRFRAVLRQFEPFGPANRAPVFVNNNLQVVGRPSIIGQDKTHLRFFVRQGNAGVAFGAIGFGMAPHAETLRESQRTGTPLRMAFHVEDNTYRGQRTLQLKPRDIRLKDEG